MTSAPSASRQTRSVKRSDGLPPTKLIKHGKGGRPSSPAAWGGAPSLLGLTWCGLPPARQGVPQSPETLVFCSVIESRPRDASLFPPVSELVYSRHDAQLALPAAHRMLCLFLFYPETSFFFSSHPHAGSPRTQGRASVWAVQRTRVVNPAFLC